MTQNTRTASGTSESKRGNGGFVAIGNLLPGASSYAPKCLTCNDTGMPSDAIMRYTPFGVPSPSAICECEAGERLRQEIEDKKAEAQEQQEQRRRNRISMLAERSNVPPRMRSWRLASYPGDPKLVEMGWAFVHGHGRVDDNGNPKYGLLLLGKTGVGKTGLALGIMNECIEEGVEALFWEMGGFLRAIRATFSPQAATSTEEVTRPARDVTLLVLDDIGDVGRGGNQVSDFTRSEVFDLVNHRYNQQLSTIYTSNLTARQLAEQFGERIWWRIADMCLVAEVAGRNLRA